MRERLSPVPPLSPVAPRGEPDRPPRRSTTDGGGTDSAVLTSWHTITLADLEAAAVEGSSGKQKRAFNRREQHPLTLIFRRPEIEALFNEAHIAQYRRRWLLATSFGAFIFTIYLVLRLTSHHELYHVTVPTQVAICVMSYALTFVIT